MSDVIKDAVARVSAYLARRDGASGFDRDEIHTFDAGCAGQTVLLSSDIAALIAHTKALEAEVAALRAGQTYRYIGKDGKTVLARDLEDERDELRAQLAEARAERDNANKIMDGKTTLHRVIADIRDASGLGPLPMLSELAAEIGRLIGAERARAARAEAERAAQIEADAGICDERGRREQDDFGLCRGTQNYYRARDAIRSQPHDRSALAKMLADARMAALREAAGLAYTSVNAGGLAKSMAFFMRAGDHAAYQKACEDYRAAILAMAEKGEG